MEVTYEPPVSFSREPYVVITFDSHTWAARIRVAGSLAEARKMIPTCDLPHTVSIVGTCIAMHNETIQQFASPAEFYGKIRRTYRGHSGLYEFVQIMHVSEYTDSVIDRLKRVDYGSYGVWLDAVQFITFNDDDIVELQIILDSNQVRIGEPDTTRDAIECPFCI